MDLYSASALDQDCWLLSRMSRNTSGAKEHAIARRQAPCIGRCLTQSLKFQTCRHKRRINRTSNEAVVILKVHCYCSFYSMQQHWVLLHELESINGISENKKKWITNSIIIWFRKGTKIACNINSQKRKGHDWIIINRIIQTQRTTW